MGSKKKNYQAPPGRNQLNRQPPFKGKPPRSSVRTNYSSEAERKVKMLRRHAIGEGGPGEGHVALVGYELKHEGTGEIATARGGKPLRERMATLASRNNPALGLGKAIREALDPVLVARPVQTLAQMPPEKRAEMERLYGRGPAKKGAAPRTSNR